MTKKQAADRFGVSGHVWKHIARKWLADRLMDIILVSHKSGRTRRFHFESRIALWLLPSVIALSVLGGIFLSGFELAEHGSARRQLPQNVVARWQAELSEQQQQVKQLRRSAASNADALSRKLAELQAQIIRLDAAGSRMAQIAGIKSNEFNFAKPVAMGGPEMPVGDEPELMTGVIDSLDALQARLKKRSRQFKALEEILLTSKLQKEVVPSGWPIDRGYISSGYGMRIDPFTGRPAFHPGIDFAGPRGTPIHAVAAGIVVRAGRDGGYGNLVEINDGNGYKTLYGHNEKILVRIGQPVSKGQVIALEGSTGRSTGPHCHLEVHIDGRTVNPARFVASRH